jgi:hypothetical protein
MLTLYGTAGLYTDEAIPSYNKNQAGLFMQRGFVCFANPLCERMLALNEYYFHLRRFLVTGLTLAKTVYYRH